MKIIIAHPGTQYSHHLARELFELNFLEKYITSFAVAAGSLWHKIFKQRLKNRVIGGVPSSRIKIYPSAELLYLIQSNWVDDIEDRIHNRNSFFQDKVIAHDIDAVDCVIGFDTSSWKLADYCRKVGKEFILDVSIGHSLTKENVFSKLRNEFPLWKDVVNKKRQKLIELEKVEYELATKIVVPSSFVKQTLIENGVNENKIYINPFGTDISGFRSERKKGSNPIVQFLFFGSLTARKGLPLLLKVWEKMDTNKSELVIAGYGNLPKGQVLPRGVKLLGAISAADRAELYDNADVFVFPSYFEGFAQVQIEAAASGLPIIGTVNSGAEEIVRNGYNGFIIETGNEVQLTNAMHYFVSNRNEIALMSKRVQENIDFFSWNSYGKRWKGIIENRLV